MTKIIYLLAHYYTKGYWLSQTHKAVLNRTTDKCCNRKEKSGISITKTCKVQEDGRRFLDINVNVALFGKSFIDARNELTDD